MPKNLQTNEIRVANATVMDLTVQDRIDFGIAQVGQSKARDVRFSLRLGRVRLQEVAIALDLSLNVDWELSIPGPNPAGSTSFTLLRETFNLPDHDVPDITPSDALVLSTDELALENFTATIDPIIGSQVGTIVARTVIENIVARKLVLPLGGATLDGLGVGALTLQGLSLPGIHIDETTLGKVSGGPMSIPRLTLSDLALPAAPPSTLETKGFELKYTINDTRIVNQSFGPITLKPTIRGEIKATIGKLRLEGVVLSGHLGSVVLEKIDLSFEAGGVRISPVDLECMTADEIKLVDQGG